MGILDKYIKEEERYKKLDLCKTCEEIVRKKQPRCLTGMLCKDCVNKIFFKKQP